MKLRWFGEKFWVLFICTFFVLCHLNNPSNALADTTNVADISPSEAFEQDLKEHIRNIQDFAMKRFIGLAEEHQYDQLLDEHVNLQLTYNNHPAVDETPASDLLNQCFQALELLFYQ